MTFAVTHTPVEARLAPLLSDTARLLRTSFDRSLRDLGLTQTQWRAILYLSRSQGMNQSALAEVMEVAPISLTRLVDRMEASGWVERGSDPDDRRATRLFLTPQVGGLLAELNRRAAAMRAHAFRGVKRSELEAAERVLLRIKANLTSEAAVAPPARAKAKVR